MIVSVVVYFGYILRCVYMFFKFDASSFNSIGTYGSTTASYWCVNFVLSVVYSVLILLMMNDIVEFVCNLFVSKWFVMM